MTLSPYNLFLSIICIFLLNNYSSAQNVQLTVKGIVSPGIPKTDSLVIMGNQAVFGNWFDFSKGKMKKQDDTTWTFTGQFPANTSLEFQITRGAYNKNALYTHGIHQSPNVPFIIKKDTVITIRPANWNDLFNNSITGKVKYYHNFEDHDLKYARNVVVWLPPSYYKSPNKRFPVLYAHDGQNVFIPNSIFSGEWRMDETADSLMRLGKIQEFIIVAIDNTKDRWEEYSGTPEGMAYINFIVNNLKPFIDKNYRTKPDKTNTAAIGSSMGGLISFYMVWLHPDVFSKAACLSSGFAYDNGRIIDKIAASSKKLPGTRLYLDCGDQDLDKYFLKDNNRMYELLKKDHPEVKLKYKVFEGAAHNEYAWAKRLSDPLTYLFDNKTQ
jgi:enterochelin esterase-like enzyme